MLATRLAKRLAILITVCIAIYLMASTKLYSKRDNVSDWPTFAVVGRVEGSTSSATYESPCPSEVKLSKKKLPLVALASFPGSGNTWARHLLQQTTGIYTSSLYKDVLLTTGEFILNPIHNGTATPIKTHERADSQNHPTFVRGILLLRDPYDALKAEYKRRKAGKIGQISAKNFNQADWIKFVTKTSDKWLEQVVSWLVVPKPLFLMKYDALKSNMKSILEAAAAFLEVETNSQMLNCALSHSEGSFHRKNDSQQTDLLYVLPESLKEHLKQKTNIVDWFVNKRCPQSPLCLPYSKMNFTGQPYQLP